MTETTTTVETPDARQASMSRVVTHETLLASLAAPALEETTKDETKVADKPKDGEQKPKKSPQDRIVELAHKRKEAEAKADAEKQRADALEIKLKALEARAAPIEDKARPQRTQFANEDDFTDALGDWKADQAIARREKQQADARQQAEFAEVVETWTKRQQKVIEQIPDYSEVLANSDIQINDDVRAALLESEVGPLIAYYFAQNPDEAKRMNGLKKVAMVKRIIALEKDLEEGDDPEPAKPKAPAPKQTKAPEPISPVRATGAAVSTGQPPTDYAAYRKHRQAMKRQ